MKNRRLKIRNGVMIAGAVFTCTIRPAFASVAYNCYGSEDERVCKIMQGSTKDGYSSFDITQDTIDSILNDEKKASKLTLEITSGNYSVYPLLFKHVKNITLQLDGGAVINAVPMDQSEQGKKKKSVWKDEDAWISFIQASNVTVKGAAPSSRQLADDRPRVNVDMPSIIDGNGQDWWKAYNKKKFDRPALLYFHGVDGLTLSDLGVRNSPRVNIMIRTAKNISINHVSIHEDEDSPNTDGINVGNVQGLQISNSTIYNGDDCIAMNSGGDPDQNIRISNIDMYYGHGISIGSNVDANVEDVKVDNVSFHHTRTGLRIKSGGGKDSKGDSNYDFSAKSNKSQVTVSNIHFSNVQMDSVKYPILYDFNYDGKWSNVQLNNITYSGVTATNTVYWPELLCHSSNNCKNITFNDVHIDKKGKCQAISMSVDNQQEDYKDKEQSCSLD